MFASSSCNFCNQMDNVKQRCLPNALNFPMRQEYDFKTDNVNPNLDMELKPHAKHRENKILSNMFENGRAKSGIMVVSCGAVRFLSGVSATARIKKSCLCLTTNYASADQWVLQFKMLSTLRDDQIICFDTHNKQVLRGNAGIVVTTYDMIASGGTILEEIEWGLLLMDKIHMVPESMRKKVIGITKSHCKLGLTAALGDEEITNLKFLMGPKLYETDWQDFSEGRFVANVKCVDIWCPMTKEFLAEYHKKENTTRKQALYVMNPNRFRACEFLIRYHEQRGDKIKVFGDVLFALKEYATKLGKPIICVKTDRLERAKILEAFKTSKDANTVFVSKAASFSLDIPEANVIIQISSHAWSDTLEAKRFRSFRKAKGELKEYNAFFYSLVSTNTEEMGYSVRRQKYFDERGYGPETITRLPPHNDTGSSLYNYSQEEELSLLAKVLKDEGELLYFGQMEGDAYRAVVKAAAEKPEPVRVKSSGIQPRQLIFKEYRGRS